MWKRKKTREELNYDSLVKTALTGHLGEAVREVQRRQAADAGVDAAIESNSEATHAFCCVVEALFIHRLRDSFVDKVSSVFSGDVIRQPSPNFWPLLMAFSHRTSIDFVLENCSWLRTDIGRCRGWIRLVLNDGMLSSYLELLATEKRLLADFYEKEAFLRDPEHMDIARKMLNGIEMFPFRLAVNSSILNSWSTTPLLLAGLWAPPTPLIQEAVVQGVDAALCFTGEDETLQPVKAPVRSPTPPSVDQDLAFRLIIESQGSIPAVLLPSPPLDVSVEELQINSSVSSPLPPSGTDPEPEPEPEAEELLVTHLRLRSSRAASPVVLDDSKIPAITELTKVEKEDKAPEKQEPPVITFPDPAATTDAVPVVTCAAVAAPTVMIPDADAINSPCTFEDLLEKYSSGLTTKSPDPADSNLSLLNSASADHGASGSCDKKELDDFELISGSDDGIQSPFLTLLPSLNNEKGLVFQNYRCADCSRPIGIIYGPYRVCSLTGLCYCADCHWDAEVILPARVFFNGDWSKRKVCRAAQKFFDEIQLDPILDAVEYNRNIYSIEPRFSELLAVRSQLIHLSAYLLTCRTNAKEEFTRKMLFKEHFYQEEHTYAMADLPAVQSGQLHLQLFQVLQFGKEHVRQCQLCTERGFICEACRCDQVIFPFDIDATYRCDKCGSIFHKECKDRFQLCPRCQRWNKAHANDEDASS